MGLYRWERRRQRQRHAKRHKIEAELFGFQLLLLVLIFFIWAVGARILTIYVVVSSPCAEMAADFGAGHSGVPMFQLFFYLSVLMAVFWGVLSFSYRKVALRGWHAFFNFSLLLMIMLLIGNFYGFRIEDNQPPDGVLAVELMNHDPINGELKPIDKMDPKWGAWAIGPSGMEDLQRCVWLERGLVNYDSNPTQIPKLNVWPSLKTAQSTQSYRSLTESERVRFIAKQACLSAIPDKLSDCDYGWVFNNIYIHSEEAGAFYP